MRKPTRKSLIKRLDTVFSLYIRKRDKRCVVCGSREYLQAGHYFSRIAHSTRWDDENTHAQCARCNVIHEQNAEPFRRFMKQKFGEAGIKRIERRYHTPRKFTDTELLELEAHLKSQLK